MSFSEKIIKIMNKFNQKDTEKLLAEHGAEKVQATLEQIDGEEAYDEATKIAIQEIKKHPELAVKILDTINENVSSKVAINTVIQLPDEEVVPESMVVKAAQQLDLEDEHKVAIIEESSLAFENQMQIAKQLEDKETRAKIQEELRTQEEEKCLYRLNGIYEMCNEDINENVLEKKINDVLKKTHVDTDAIQDKINRIIARKIAFNYATYGTNIVSKQRQLMSAQEMNEKNMVQIAKEEYKKIASEYETIRGVKVKEFNEEELNYNILKEIEATALTEGFNEETILREIRSMMKTLMYDERRELLTETKREIEDENIRKTKHNIRETGIVEILSELPENEREKALEAFKDVIDKRRNMLKEVKVEEKTTEINTEELKETPHNASEDGR